MANKQQNPKKKKAVDKPVPEKAMHEMQQKLVMDKPIDGQINGKKLETNGESTDKVTTNGEEKGEEVEKKVEEKSKILVSFSNQNGSKHNFGWTSLEGGEAVHLALAWRAVSDSRVYPYVFGSEGVCVNDAMHWLDLGKQVVVAFALEVEKFYLLSLPQNIPSISSLTQIAGSLALLSGVNFKGATEFWVLEDYPSSRWIKKCVVYLQNNRMRMSPIGVGTVDCGLLALTAPLNLYELKCEFVPLYQKDRNPRVFKYLGYLVGLTRTVTLDSA
ncbi:hypothetical protein RJ639_003570 [Escallonia herrerae]|uniref:F-box associated beta-propeller type 3 domain-containing protein n=1 Tax=Escallonia herrerae TaxID=1293975 RepID=A0AA88W896_9ASTE|nr:hypothetical protein RJ639_003570 [Escallonia herrerae]